MDKNLIHQNRKETWETPPAIFQPLSEFYQFTIDLAADEKNHLLPRWIGPGSVLGEDFLKLHPDNLVGEVCFINPPYGGYLPPFTAQIAMLAGFGIHIVALLPASLDPGWFWDNVHGRAELHGRRGRIQFLLDGKPAMRIDKKTGKLTKNSNQGASILAVYNMAHLREPPGWKVL